MAATAPFEGTERFAVVREIGVGGMGVVYEAHDREQDRPVALKLLRKLSPEGLLRFKREYRALRDLRHPNLVRLGDLVEERGRWFFTMELIHGEQLLSYVRPDGILDEARLRACLVQIVRGLAALHDAGRVHRDVKPSNVLVTPDGRAVILDLGLTTDVEGGNLTASKVVGTSEFMAPEQSMGGLEVTPAADWYSLGIVMYEALTGTLPFSGSHLKMSSIKQSLDAPRPSEAEGVGDIDEDLDEVCAGLIRVAPEERLDAAALLARLDRRSDRRRATTVVGSSELVGRARELAQVREALELSRDGARTIYVRGESGIGKTAFIRSCFADHRDRVAADVGHPIVLTGRCYGRESVPYRAMDEAIDALAHELARFDDARVVRYLPEDAGFVARAFPVLRRVREIASAPRPRSSQHTAQDMRVRAFAGLRELLARLAYDMPIAFVLDDMQWVDDDSIDLLTELLRPPDAPAILVVMAERNDAVGGSVPQWIPGEVERIDLGPLDRDDATALAAQLLEDAGEPAELAEDIAESAGAHPLFIHEMVRAAIEGTPGDDIDELLEARLARVSGGALAILELVAVAGAPLPQGVAAGAVGVDFGDFVEHVADLVSRRLVLSDGTRKTDEVEIYHARVRDVVLRRVGSERRRAHHRAIAVAMEQRGDIPPSSLAHHWAHGGEPDRAREHGLAAAKHAASVYSFDRAARQYRAMLGLGDPDRADVYEIHCQLAECLQLAGRSVDAAEAYLAAAELGPEDMAIDLQRRAAIELLRAGEIDRGVELLRGVLGAYELSMPRGRFRALAAVAWRRARLSMRGMRYTERRRDELHPRDVAKVDTLAGVCLGLGGVDPLLTAYFQAEHLAAALALGENRRLQRAMAIEVLVRAGDGTRGDAKVLPALRRLSELTNQVGSSYARAMAEAAEGGAAVLAGHFAAGRDHCRRAVELFRRRCVGTDREVYLCLYFQLHAHIYLGELDVIGRRLPDALRYAVKHGDLFAAYGLRVGPTNSWWLAKDDPDAAEREAAAAEAHWTSRDYHVQHHLVHIARCEIDLYRGDGGAAAARLAENEAAIRRALIDRMQFTRVQRAFAAGRAAVLALASGDASGGKRAAAAARALDREEAAWATAMAAAVRAGRAAASSDPAAESLATRAAELAEVADLGLLAAAARRAAALAAGNEDAARAAERSLADRTVRAPARMARCLVPGFD